jgi:hypothetical protein
MPRLMRKPGSVNIYSDPILGEIETHASTCRHCQHSTEFPSLKVMMDYVEWCRGCNHLICLNCVGKPCRPYEAEADRLENLEYLKSRIHVQAWKCY